MVRRNMSKGTNGGGATKGHKGNRRAPSQPQPVPQATHQQKLINSTEHNNNTKSNPASTHPSSSVVVLPQTINNKIPQQSNKQAIVGKVHKDKNQQHHHLESQSATTAATIPPPAPSSSPIPAEAEDDFDVEELEVDVDDVDEDLEDEEDDLEEEEDEDDLDEDDEYDGHDDLTEPCESRTPGVPGGSGGPPTNNNSASSYNSPNFLGSSSEEEDDDEVEADESLDRDESEEEEEEDDEDGLEPSGFLLPPDGDPSSIQGIPPDAQARLEAFFEAAGFTDGKLMSDPENLRKLTLTVSSALGEASAAINRMRDSQRKSIEEGRNDSMEEGDSLLALACSSGYFELARVLLAMGANVDDRGSKGDLTPLMDAASQGHVEIVKLLISHGADVNAQSACGNSPLMYACSAGHEDIVKELLKAGARVEDNNENGHTPLMEAASSGHVNVAKILLEHGAGINTHSNEFKESALTVACYKGHLEMVRFLLDAGADQQHKTDEMHTALMEASMDGHVEVAKLLLESGAQVNMPADSFESPLTLAACGGHVELAELLISRGANIEEVNDEGYTPLMEAAREGHLSVVKCLLKNGTKINGETDETHETALTLSACGGFLDVVDTLCHHGADIEVGASTPLMEAAQEGHLGVVRYLLDRGADITRETQTGDTALSYACENGHVDVVELLVEKGANHEHISEGGRTPLMKACRGGHVDVIKFLLSKGADVNRQTASNDHTPLSLACAGGHIAAVEVLLTSGANPYHKLKDNSTMIIEAARGGHTSVIRALLDFAPNKEKGSQPTGGKQQVKGQSGQACQQKGQQIVDSSKTSASQTQGKSVLRKSRSTSMLDSSVQQKSESVACDGKSAKVLPPMTSIPTDSPLLKNMNLPLGDGKVQNSSEAESRKKPVPVPASCITPSETKNNGAPGGNRKTAMPSQSSSVSTNLIATSNINATVPVTTPGTNVCTECINAKSSGEGGHHGVHVKRAAMDCGVVPVSPGGSNSSASTCGASSTNSPPGPPLVPSQVTAATAISERPKAKANKPSARKQLQFQQQIQQSLAVQQAMHIEQQRKIALNKWQKQQQQCVGENGQGTGGMIPTSSPVTSSPSGGTSPGSINPSSSSSSCGGVLSSSGAVQDFSINRLVAAGSGGNSSGLTAPPGPSPPYVTGQTALLQMQVQQVSRTGNKTSSSSSHEKHYTLDAKQLMQIFTQHHQSQLIYKGERGKFECYEGLSYDPTSSEMIDLTQVVGGTVYPMSPCSSPQGSQQPSSPLSGLGVSPGSGVGTVAIPGGGFGSSSSQGSSPESTGSGTTTTTTTTTVVVTHGNGETETIIDGDLPPGTNEMIINAAAAAFPIDCYVPGGQVQVQSYQLSTASPAGLSVGVGVGELLPGLPPLTTTTMHTTTIINSAGISAAPGVGNFQPQMIIPHQPNLPSGISSTGASTGFLSPSGSITSSLDQSAAGIVNRHIQLQQQQAKKNAVSSSVKDKIGGGGGVTNSPGKNTFTHETQVTFTQQQQQQQQHPPPPSAVGPMKKQTAKRTRPFGPGHGSACSNQKGGSHSVASTQTGNDPKTKALDVDSATDSNGETSLSIAAAQGHYEVVEFLLTRKAHIEHRDKKGCTPLILAADGGHDKVVELLLNHGADIEAQSERTKDTALSLACTKGRYEVVDLLIKRQANKEHRNVSDYTPLSLAASGGFVNIIKLLLHHGAEINSRTGSKLGISPLMLAAMNGNTAAVKLLLDQGSDINAQIETNKNTALTLACFQGRHEVVQLLLDRKANLEHRAKTGLTPLMEAANGGYVDVGRVLIEKGADVNAAPVPATRDTALTIAADKGHYRFVELLLQYHANVEVRNKKGCTPMWLACNGGHLDVCQVLQKHRSDVDAQDNRKISCLMAAFKKGHVKVVRWIVRFVKQFPNDQEMSRYFLGLTNEPELLKRAQQCMEFIKQAKDKQALEASKNANILLEELELEKFREESKRLAAAKRREKKKKKKMEKKQLFPTQDGEDDDRDDDNDDDDENDEDNAILEMMDSGIDVNSQGSNSSSQTEQRNKSALTLKDGKGNKENLLQQQTNQKTAKTKNNRDNRVNPLPQELEEEEEDEQVLEPVKKEEPIKETYSKNQKKKKTKGGSKNNTNESTPEPQLVPPQPQQVESTQLPHQKKGVIEKENLKSGKNSISTSKSDKDVLKEKVKEVDEVNTGSGVNKNNKKDKKTTSSVVEEKKIQPKEGIDKEMIQQQQYTQQSTLKGTSAILHGNIPNKKGKGDAFSHPEPLMGISLHPSQLRKNVFASEHETHCTTHSHSNITTFVPPPNAQIGMKSSSGPVGTQSGILSSTGAPGQKPSGPGGRKDDGWKEVTRSCTSSRSKKVIVSSSVISRVIGRGGCNINAIREATGAHIEVEKQQKGALQPERTIQIKGSADSTKQAYNLINALMNEPDVDIKKLIPQHRLANAAAAAAASAVAGGVILPGTIGRLTPNILNNVNAFPVIGSASAPLPPIGQPMTASSSSSSVSPPVVLNINTSNSSSLSQNSSAPVDIVNSCSNKTGSYNKSGGIKGSPNTRNNVNISSSSISPPISSSGGMKNGSPPLKKPIVVNNSNTFEIGNFSVSEANAETYNNSNKASYSSYSGKRSMVFTPSVSSSSNTNVTNSSSFAAKLNNQQHGGGGGGHGHGRGDGDHHHLNHNDNINLNWDGSVRQQNQRTLTPTLTGGKKTPISSGFVVGGSSTISPPLLPVSSMNGQVPHHRSGGNNSSGQVRLNQQQQQQIGQNLESNIRQQIPNVLHSMVQNFNSGGGIERKKEQQINVEREVNGTGGDQSGFVGSGVGPRNNNLAPGSGSNSGNNQSSNVIGSNRSVVSNVGNERSSSEASNQDQQQQPPPLEYSPFNYTFSKTSGWFPGDLAVRENSSGNGNNQQNFGTSNLMSSLSQGGSTSALSAARAMNFASVAASGISSSMSTTTAQMSQAVIGHGIPNGTGGLVSMGPKVSSEGSIIMECEPKAADASKAPGYRGNTTMGSPVMRMHQQNPQQNLQQSNAMQQQQQQQQGYGNLDTGFGGGIVPGLMGYGNQPRQNYGPGVGMGQSGQFQPQDMASSALINPLNHQQGMNDGNHLMYQNNRLNPRAPSFMTKVQPGQQQQQQTGSQQGNTTSAFVSTQQPNQFNMQQQQQYKMNQQQQQQFGARPSAPGMGNGGRNGGVGSGWNGYGGNASLVEDQMANFGLAGLTGGMIDPSVLLSGMERLQSLHDPQSAMKMEQDRRLPRPIGGERSYKTGSTVGSGGVIGSGMNTFSGLDCLDSGSTAQPGNGGPGNSWNGPSPVGGLVGMYGNVNPPTSVQGQMHGGHGPPLQGPPQGPRGDRGNVFGRRLMDEMDTNRIFELQQQLYDGQPRMMNGGGVPQMMHSHLPLPNAPPPPNPHMYPFGLDQHLDQHNIPKMDQPWDSHLLMDDKHMQGGWGGAKWGN